jgi:beta-glucosidase
MAIPTENLKTPIGAPGLERKQGRASTIDSAIDFVGSRALPVDTTAMWSGTLHVPENGRYLLMMQSWGGSAILKVDGKPVTTSAKIPFHGIPKKWTSLLSTTDGLDNGQADLQLKSGKEYSIAVELAAYPSQPVQVRLAWVTPPMRRQMISDAVTLARRVHTAVVFAWGKSGEVADVEDDLLLPDEQNTLIEAVAAANPRTVVVLNTGAPVLMPWRDKVKAILEMWYPGQEGGWATADILLGTANPGGKLPITFPQGVGDTPTKEKGHSERYLPENDTVRFTEGLLVGYRWYDTRKIKPLYPFGYGQSYTRFRYADLKVKREGSDVRVTFTVTNSGRVRGSEVAQLYLGAAPQSPVPVPSKSLAGFAKVELEPEQSKTITVDVPQRAFSYWSAERKEWLVIPGWRSIMVGGSSDDLPLKGVAGYEM